MIDRSAHIRGEADRFGAALAGTDPSAPVPTCPDWTALDLARHLTEVHAFWADVIGQRLSGADVGAREENAPPLPQEMSPLLQERARATETLLAALGGRDPAEEAWSWFPPDQTVGFTWRMQTHEATMHRVDAELAACLPIGAIPTDVAVDGVEHMIDVMWAWLPPDAERRVLGTVELVATDADRSWLVHPVRWSGQAWGQTFTDHIGCVRAASGSPDAVVSGAAADLDLLVWTRADRGITRSGDAAALAAFQEVLSAGVQ